MASKLSSYKPSLADKTKVGFFRSDVSSQTDSSEILDLKEMIDVFTRLREELGDLRQDLSRSKTVLQADYDSKLSDRVIELYCRVNDKVSFLERVHGESIDRVRHGCRTQLADAIAQIHGEHKAYLKKAIASLKAQHEQEMAGLNARLVNMKRQLYDYQQIINWLQSQVPQGTVRTRLPTFLLQPANKHVLSGLSDSFRSAAGDETQGTNTPPSGMQGLRRESTVNPMAPDPITKAMEDTLSDRLTEIFQLESEIRERDGTIASLQNENEQLREELTNLREMIDVQMIADDDEGGTGMRWATEKEIEARIERKYSLRLEAIEDRHKEEMQQIRADFNEANRRWSRKLLVVQNAIYKLHDENIVSTILSKQTAVFQYAAAALKHGDATPGSARGSTGRSNSRRFRLQNGGSASSLAGSLPSLRQGSSGGSSGSGISKRAQLRPLHREGDDASVDKGDNGVSEWVASTTSATSLASDGIVSAVSAESQSPDGQHGADSRSSTSPPKRAHSGLSGSQKQSSSRPSSAAGASPPRPFKRLLAGEQQRPRSAHGPTPAALAPLPPPRPSSASRVVRSTSQKQRAEQQATAETTTDASAGATAGASTAVGITPPRASPTPEGTGTQTEEDVSDERAGSVGQLGGSESEASLGAAQTRDGTPAPATAAEEGAPAVDENSVAESARDENGAGPSAAVDFQESAAVALGAPLEGALAQSSQVPNGSEFSVAEDGGAADGDVSATQVSGADGLVVPSDESDLDRSVVSMADSGGPSSTHLDVSYAPGHGPLIGRRKEEAGSDAGDDALDISLDESVTDAARGGPRVSAGSPTPAWPIESDLDEDSAPMPTAGAGGAETAGEQGPVENAGEGAAPAKSSEDADASHAPDVSAEVAEVAGGEDDANGKDLLANNSETEQPLPPAGN